MINCISNSLGRKPPKKHHPNLLFARPKSRVTTPIRKLVAVQFQYPSNRRRKRKRLRRIGRAHWINQPRLNKKIRIFSKIPRIAMLSG
jgi:hypothetical protein